MSEKETRQPIRTRRRYDTEFKRAAVENYKKNGSNLSQTSQELGINIWTLRDWIEADREGNGPVKGDQTKEELQEQVQRLQKELNRVTEQRDILKKSLGILSNT